MKTKHIPMRSCVVTKERCEKKDLIRIVRTPEKKIVIDETGKQNGRGAYIKKDLEVLKTCEQKKILEHILGVNVEKEIYEELRHIIAK